MSWLSDRVQDTYDYLNPEPLHPSPDEARMRGWRMGQTVEPAPDEAAMAQAAREVAARRIRGELAPSAAVERRFGAFAEPSAPAPPPPPSRADAYRMAGLAEMDQYREAPKDAYKRSDVEASARDIVPNANMNEFAASPGEVAAIDQQLDAPLTKEAIDTLRWHGLSDAAIGALSGTTAARYIPDKRVRAAAMVAPIMGALMDPAEAGPRDPRFWHGISANKLSKPIGEMLAEKTPTQTVRERFISPEALQGGVMLPAPGDRAQIGEQLLGVGGKRFDIPTELQGGHGYMPANVDQGHVWASDQGVISTMGDRLKRLRDQYANVYLPYSAMGERSVDFSHHMSDTLSEMVKDAKIVKKSKDPDKMTAATFNEAMREPWGDFPKAIEKFPGIQSPDLRQWLIDAPGKTRSKFAQLMDQAPYQSAGFPDVAEARFAVTDPRLLHEPTGAAGLSISRPNPNVIEPSGHRTYSTALGGDYVGGFEHSIPREVMFPDIVKAYAERRTKHGEPFNPSQQDYAFRMGTPPFFQKTDDQWLEGVMRYLEATRNAQR